MTPIPTVPETGQTVDQIRWFAGEVHPHGSQLEAYLRGSFPSVHDVDGLVQESYRHLRRRQLGAPIQSAKSFLFIIARNRAIDALRHGTRNPVDSVADIARRAVFDTGATRVKVHFDLPADAAEKSLRLFSRQSGLEVVFAAGIATGIRTRPVKGEMAARQALDAMLKGTGLAVFEDGSGAFSIQPAASVEDAAKPAPPPPRSNEKK